MVAPRVGPGTGVGLRWLLWAAALLALAAFVPMLFRTTSAQLDDPPQPFHRGRLDFVRVGTVETLLPPRPTSVAILLSGDGGWSPFNEAMAGRMAGDGALVLGVDTTRYLALVGRSRGDCHSAAADFQMLAQFAEQKLGLPSYREPIVVGYSAGASLAWLAAEEAPAALKGAISLSFPPDVLGPDRPFCTGRAAPPQRIEGGWLYRPAPVGTPFVIIQGSADTVVPPGPARAFAAAVPGARYVEVPGLSHNYFGFGDWWTAFEAEYARIAGTAAARAAAVAALPLTEVPAAAAAAGGDTFAVFLSGDGGWADLDKQVAGMLAAKGLPVVGWSSLKYFWTEKAPERAAADLDAVIRAYAARWQRPRVLLIGYSFGADTLPAMIERLPPASRARVVGLVSIAGSSTASYRFSTLDWFNAAPDTGPPVAPVMARLHLPVLCIYGRDDKGALCPQLPRGVATVLAMPGGHHIGGNFAAVVPPILELAAPVTSADRRTLH